MTEFVHPSALAHRIDPQMRPQLEKFLSIVGPNGFYGIRNLRDRRACFDEIMALVQSRSPDSARVRRLDQTIRRGGGAAPLDVRIYRAADVTGPRPGILYMHGGGMIMGSVAADDGFAATLAEDTGCIVVSVDYGLAPENPGTGPVKDCYDALLWLHENSVDLGIVRESLALYGVSAGGGLACGVALLAQDRNGPDLAYQMLIYPMLDDRNDTRSSHAIIDLGIWDRAANLEAWSHLLGDRAGSGNVSPYVAPARATEVVGLPSTYIEVGDLDLFLDEDLELARRLKQADVALELHTYPGAYHGFDQFAPRADTTVAAVRNRITALCRALDRPAPVSLAE